MKNDIISDVEYDVLTDWFDVIEESSLVDLDLIGRSHLPVRALMMKSSIS